jgi:hypothetical protein
MKNLLYVALVLFSIITISCTEEVVTPKVVGEDDPIAIPPPPIKK